MKNALFDRLAELELSDAMDYYNDETPGLGDQLLEEVSHAVILLSRYPKSAPKFLGPIRRLTLPRFPYYVLYRPLGKGVIRILAVAHQKRHPRYWIGR